MNRRLLTAAAVLLALAACGMPEGSELDDPSFGSLTQSVDGKPVSPGGAVSSTQDPVPATPDQLVVVDDSNASNPLLILLSAGPSDPGGDVSSTQDPIPAKVRMPNPDGPGSASSNPNAINTAAPR